MDDNSDFHLVGYKNFLLEPKVLQYNFLLEPKVLQYNFLLEPKVLQYNFLLEPKVLLLQYNFGISFAHFKLLKLTNRHILPEMYCISKV